MPTYTERTGTTPTYTVVNSDADTVPGVTDFDDSGKIKRRFDEPHETHTQTTVPVTTWTER